MLTGCRALPPLQVLLVCRGSFCRCHMPSLLDDAGRIRTLVHTQNASCRPQVSSMVLLLSDGAHRRKHCLGCVIPCIPCSALPCAQIQHNSIDLICDKTAT